jgi:hypothetical protein
MNAIEARPWEQVPARLTALASGIEARQPAQAIMGLLEHTRSSCQEAVGTARAHALKPLLAQVETAARTWQQVWPRLGGDREFRLAVAREARLWAKRLAEEAAR